MRNRFFHFIGITTFSLIVVLISFENIVFADLDDERDLGKTSSKPAPTSTPNIPNRKGLVEPNLGSGEESDSLKNEKINTEMMQPKENTSQKPKQSGQKANVNKKIGEKDQQQDRKLPINWSAKGLRGSKDSKVVDLKDDVIVTQGKLKLEADKARVFFNEQDEVTKVLATGNVKVTKSADESQERISARGNEAVFDNTKRTVTMIGRAALWRGGDVVRGKQITYSIDSGWISVDSVEGVVQPSEENTPK